MSVLVNGFGYRQGDTVVRPNQTFVGELVGEVNEFENLTAEIEELELDGETD